jgi:sec-independent protein translocase protein TatB
MFNLGAGEIAVILVVALLLLGPNKLPELARGMGKFMREFRRQTDDVRGMVEREFYKMDQDVFAEDQVKRIEPPKADATPAAAAGDAAALPPPEYPSVFPPPEGVVASHPAPAVSPAPETPDPAVAGEGEPKAHG